MTNEQIEERVRELFERQAGAVAVLDRTWDEPVATVTELEPRRRRWTGAAIAAAVTAGAAVVALVAFGVGGTGSVRTDDTANQPGAPRLSYESGRVALSADAITIGAGGRQFDMRGQHVAIHGDPGNDEYETLELEWSDAGTPQRLYIYFASDGRDWWVTEMRTRDGKPEPEADWVAYQREVARTPLGSAFTGTLKLAPTEGRGSLEITNAKLQPFLPPAGCEAATAKYVIDSAYGSAITFPAGEMNGYGLRFDLLDTATCSPVEGARFTYSTEAPVRFTGHEGGGVQITSDAPGTANLHVIARLRPEGPVVASFDVRVTTN